MANRILPGAYSSLEDLSQVPEGQTSLVVGAVLKANKGPVGVPTLVTPSTFMDTFYYGNPTIKDDPTYLSIRKVLNYTDRVYVSRAANNPLYGGAVIKKAKTYGYFIGANQENQTVTISGVVTLNAGDIITVPYIGTLKVASTTQDTNTTVKVTSDYKVNLTGTYTNQIQNIENSKVTVKGAINRVYGAALTSITIVGSTETANNGTFTVNKTEYKADSDTTEITLEKSLTTATDGNIYYEGSVTSCPIQPLATGLSKPSAYSFQEDDIYLILGSTPGDFTNKISLEIVSSTDPDSNMTYKKGNRLTDDVYCTFDTINLILRDKATNNRLENYIFSIDRNATSIDGISMYAENVVNGSNYIQIVVNEEATNTPDGTDGSTVVMGGGDNGQAVTEQDLVNALEPFTNKTIQLSILLNGSSAQAESAIFQQALIETAENRKDLMLFLNSPLNEEQAELSSTRVTDIIAYKKNLGSVSYYANMTTPHIKLPDTFNNRQAVVGADGLVAAGWLNVINTLGYPYAYAGPRNGLVTGATVDWQIGDQSGEAEALNDASINFIAFDSLVGRYYMQCQNTLQVANSSLRNIGAVMNVLDIKEHLITLLKEYIQLPITDTLRRNIKDTCVNYLSPLEGNRFLGYVFNDVTTDQDLADNTLRYLLTVKLTPYAQTIYLAMKVVNATFDFSIYQAA